MSTNRISVTPAQLLNRPEANIYGARARDRIRGRRILVTGAGGSIGSELVRQVTQLEPEIVFLLDHDENALHSVQLDLHGHGLLDDKTLILADIREGAVIDRVMADAQPDLVFHAAAHKHLPLLERYPSEGVRTNILGTSNVVTAAQINGVETFVNISTDKAARPTSVLGATKRLAEMIVTSHADRRMKVASVRFGNVLGSHGSFLRSMATQVERGLPVTVTDPEVTRFFMTIPEAAGLVVESAVMAKAGEIYVLDMGEPMRILDLARQYYAALGITDTNIQFTGLRPGEKLHEELYDEHEVRQPTRHPRISCVKEYWDEKAPSAIRRALTLAHVDPFATAAQVREDIFDLLPDIAAAPISPAMLTSPSALAHV